MVDIISKTYERNSLETIVDNDDTDGVFWLNEKHRKRIKS